MIANEESYGYEKSYLESKYIGKRGECVEIGCGDSDCDSDVDGVVKFDFKLFVLAISLVEIVYVLERVITSILYSVWENDMGKVDDQNKVSMM